MALPERATWRNPRLLSILLLVFIAGGLVGVVATKEFDRKSRLIFRPSSGVQLSYEQLKRDLNLSTAQADQLRSILDDTYKYNQDLQLQIEDVRATGKNRIRAILAPEQRERFEKLCASIQGR
jgi:hypothetical protein